jgi:phosphotransferase system HPr (HPr) family protein
MSDAVKRIVVVANQAGLHARAAVMVVTEAKKFRARVVISKGDQEVEATDVLQMMSLGAAQGEELSLEAQGEEAAEAAEAIERLFLRKFDED